MDPPLPLRFAPRSSPPCIPALSIPLLSFILFFAFLFYSFFFVTTHDDIYP